MPVLLCLGNRQTLWRTAILANRLKFAEMGDWHDCRRPEGFGEYGDGHEGSLFGKLFFPVDTFAAGLIIPLR